MVQQDCYPYAKGQICQMRKPLITFMTILGLFSCQTKGTSDLIKKDLAGAEVRCSNKSTEKHKSAGLRTYEGSIIMKKYEDLDVKAIDASNENAVTKKTMQMLGVALGRGFIAVAGDFSFIEDESDAEYKTIYLCDVTNLRPAAISNF